MTAQPLLDYKIARPILKWAGGKTQLLPQIDLALPVKLKMGAVKRYIEPFVGGGSLFFDLSGRFDFDDSFLFDINPELIILYNSVKNSPDDLIEELYKIQNQYYSCADRTEYYYSRRVEYNDFDKNINANRQSPDFIRRAALTVFLNRTCFNGLFRVNGRGLFNVPVGRYENPRILDEENLRNVSEALQKAVVMHNDFSAALEYADRDTFVYYDPPYRPVSGTSAFNSFASADFGDSEQLRLHRCFAQAHKAGVLQMLSNSDPTNYSADSFFDDLYAGFNIRRVSAKRRINSKSGGRGQIRELLITNY